MNLTVCLPSLLWPSSLIEQATAGLEAPALAGLLAAAKERNTSPMGMEDWFALRLGSAEALAAQCASADALPPGDDFWLFAAPAHFAVGHDDVEFAQLLSLASDEAQMLAATLNAHFRDDGLRFVCGASGRLYAHTAATPAVRFAPPQLALHRPVRAHLPQGPEARLWFRWGNEIQMLLYEHALNRRREAAAQPAINSIWFWGGGRADAAPRAAELRLFGGDALAALLARAHGAEVKPLPATPSALLSECSRATDNLLWFTALDAAYYAGDADAWRTALAKLDDDWLAPLATAFDTDRITQLTLVLGGREVTMNFAGRRRPWLARWLPRRAAAAATVLRGLAAA